MDRVFKIKGFMHDKMLFALIVTIPILAGFLIGGKPYLAIAVILVAVILGAGFKYVEIMFCLICFGLFISLPALVMDNRLFVASMPLSIRDFIALVVLLFVIIKIFFLGRQYSALNITFSPNLAMAAFFLYITVLGLIIGVANGNPVYLILRDYRIIFYLWIGYLYGFKTLSTSQQVKKIIWITLFFNLLVSSWQYYQLFFADYSSQWSNPVGYGRWVREHFLELPNTGLFLVVGLLLSYPLILGRSKLWVLLVIWFLNVILSFTRNQWVCTIVAFAALPFLLGMWRKVILGSILIVAGITMTSLLLMSVFPDVFQLYFYNLLNVIDVTISGQELNQQVRLNATLAGWQTLLSSFLNIVGGYGFGTDITEKILMEMAFFDATDGYLWFALRTGLPGMVLLIFILTIFLRTSYILARRSPQPLYQAFGISQCLYIIFEMGRTFFASGVTYWPRTIYIGCMFGIIASMYQGTLSEKNI